MKIQIGEVLMNTAKVTYPIKNKTLLYLIPCLKRYGEEFKQMYTGPFKLALGIGDMIVAGQYERHLFILIDTRIKTKLFIAFLNWVREQEYYQEDYVYGDIKKSPCHMVIVKIPDEFTESFEKFTLGKYSEMYTLNQIDELFSNHPETKKVLVKDRLYAIKFVRRLNKEYNTNMSTDEYLEGGELDRPPITQEEYFE